MFRCGNGPRRSDLPRRGRGATPTAPQLVYERSACEHISRFDPVHAVPLAQIRVVTEKYATDIEALYTATLSPNVHEPATAPALARN